MEDSRLSGILLAFCQQFASMPYIILIMLSVLLICSRMSSYISSSKRFLLVKTIQAITFQVYLHKLQVAGVESFLPVQL